jgi:hypothetical protein
MTRYGTILTWAALILANVGVVAVLATSLGVSTSDTRSITFELKDNADNDVFTMRLPDGLPGVIELQQRSAPPVVNPPPGRWFLWFQSGGLYAKNASGVVQVFEMKKAP